MACYHAIVAGLVVLALAGCDEAPASQAEASAPATGGVKLDGSTVSLANGLVTLEVPSGWRRVDGAKHFEIEAERHATSPDQWARCNVVMGGLPNIRGASQEEANQIIAAGEPQTVKTAREDGLLLDYSTSDFVGDAVVARTRLQTRKRYTDMRNIGLVHGMLVSMVQVGCDTSLPVEEANQREIEAFLGSLKINR